VTTGEAVFHRLQQLARVQRTETGQLAATSEFLTRHCLESFLDRLTRTQHGRDFILKGGILLAVYGVRRATKDVDAEAVSANVTAAHLKQVVHDIAAISIDDGVAFDMDSITVHQIREAADYPGLRVKVRASVGASPITVTWDVSAGDPVVPAPRLVSVPRVLGEPIQMLGYAPETTVAEKGVTILERGTTSTRWRDYIDIVRLAEDHGLNPDLLLEAAQAVARYRGVTLTPITSVIAGYGAIGQAKWAAWRRKEKMEHLSEPDLDAQMARVAAILDPVFSAGPADDIDDSRNPHPDIRG